VNIIETYHNFHKCHTYFNEVVDRPAQRPLAKYF